MDIATGAFGVSVSPTIRSRPRTRCGWLGAVQAQDYRRPSGPRQRTRDATAADVHRLFDAGTIVRTHVLRPTGTSRSPPTSGGCSP